MKLSNEQKKYLYNAPSFDKHLEEQLKDVEYQRIWLEETLKEFLSDGDVENFIEALTFVVKARGRGEISRLSKNINIDRSNLSDIINGKKKPHLDTVFKLLKGLGYDYNITLTQSA